MTPKKKLIIIGVVIWVLGLLYLGPKAAKEVHSDLKDAMEGRKTFDGDGMWDYLRGIAFPSFLVEKDKDEKEK